METTEAFVGDFIRSEVKIVFIIIGIFYVVMGTGGNLLIISAVATYRVLRTLHNIYIVNLAVADLIILGYIITCNLVDLLTGRYPATGEAHCIFNGFLVVWAYVTSLLTLTVISVNRYLNICHNEHYHRIFNKHTAGIICVGIWIMSALLALPPLVGWGRYGYDRKGHYCGYDRTANFGYTLFLLLASIAIPAIIIFICNFLIYRFIKHAKMRVRQSGRFYKRPPSSADISVVKMLFAVFLCFAVLMSPYMITTIADIDDTWPAILHLICAYTSFTNSCVNWFLYGLMNRNFREGYKKLIFFWRKSTINASVNGSVKEVTSKDRNNSNPSTADVELQAASGIKGDNPHSNNLLMVKPHVHKKDSPCEEHKK